MKFPRICLYIFFATTLLIGTADCRQATATPTALPTADPTPAATVVPATLQPVDSERTLTVNGLERTYLIHVPPGLATDQPVPLVFVFHGLGEAPISSNKPVVSMKFPIQTASSSSIRTGAAQAAHSPGMPVDVVDWFLITTKV